MSFIFKIPKECTWKVCNKPKRNPDKISYKTSRIEVDGNKLDATIEKLGDTYRNHKKIEDGFNDFLVVFEDKKIGISSRYWQGEDSKGKYAIRESDHWDYVGKSLWKTTKDNKKKKLKCAKIYLN